jgi:hypothetical protein
MSKNTKHKWEFKARFRSGAYSWNGTSLASKRLKEALAEIKTVAKSDQETAAEGTVDLMERIWPSLEHIDTSSGAMGNAVYGTLMELIPVLKNAPLDIQTRGKLLERLYEAVQDDGVDYLSPVTDEWGSICVFPELVNKWADYLLPTVEMCFSDKPGSSFRGSIACLSCLLQAGRYEELKSVLYLKKYPSWFYDKFWAEALVRQNRVDEALAYAESVLKKGYDSSRISEFCERTLMNAGRADEAYDRYAYESKSGQTYINQFRNTVKKYPSKEPRVILQDFIRWSGEKGAWFASARQMGHLDIALDCALSGNVDPKTLIRVAKDTVETSPAFSMNVAIRAVDLLLQGFGYEIRILDMHLAFGHAMAAARKINSEEKAKLALKELVERKYSCHRDLHGTLASLLGR